MLDDSVRGGGEGRIYQSRDNAAFLTNGNHLPSPLLLASAAL